MTEPSLGAIFYDGETAHRQPVSLSFSSQTLDIHGEGRLVASWRYDRLARLEAPPGLMRLSSAEAPELARLEIVDDGDQSAVLSRCPALARPAHTDQGGVLKIVAWSLAAAVSLILSVVYLVPVVADRLAPLIPADVERHVGIAVDNQVRAVLGDKVCDEPAGRAALAKLSAGLIRGEELTVSPDIAVLDSRVPNAFALPGGRIYLLDGLLERAETPDELAGVLAHEIGHVAHRDGLRKLIQAGGSSFLLGLLFGDVTGSGAVIFVARAVLDGTYSRDAERAADTFAADIMERLGRSPKAMGILLDRITRDHGGERPVWLSSHPVTGERLKYLEGREPAVPGPELLDAEEWRALKSICKSE